MSDIEQAKSLFSQGIALFENGDLQAAHDSFEQALVLAPQRPSVLLNLGITRMQLGRWEDAAEPLQLSLAGDPQQVDGWVALGMVCNRLGQLPQALHAYQQLLQMDEQHALAWGESANVLREMNRYEEAARHYQRALALQPGHELYAYYLSALGGEGGPAHPPPQYVQGLFDQYAEDFEDHLVGALQYRGHSHLIKHLPTEAAERFEHVLDLGCGTGLCGPLIRSRAGQLWGIDLAAAMVEKSRQLGVYDQVRQADCTRFLRDCLQDWDLVLAADVFIYVGALEELFGALSLRMPPGSWLAFTAESCEDSTEPGRPRLLASLRYAHPLSYLQNVAKCYGFVWRSHHTAPLRLDQGQPMQALYAYLQRMPQVADTK